MITFRRAIRENVPLILGLAGASGAGKTYSAMRLAKGIAGDKPFAVLDTEAGRAKHYADSFAFDHADLRPPFRPSAYREAIEAADKAGYPVIVVDSCSHEHAGDGGLLDWHDEELDRMAGQDWKRRESCAMAAWIKPKADHKKFVSKLLQLRSHLILCFRAEQKIEVKRNADGKMEIVPKQIASGFSDWIPICEKNMLYELTASFLLAPGNPGIPQPIKLPEQLRKLIDLREPLSEAVGRHLAIWAQGSSGEKAAVPRKAASPPPTRAKPPQTEAPPVDGEDQLPQPTTLTAADTCRQFRLAESIAELAAAMNSWQAESHLHTAEERQQVNATFAEHKKRFATRQ